MKQHARLYVPTDRIWSIQPAVAEATNVEQGVRARRDARADVDRSGWPTTTQLVGILAFCQSVLFLLLWLFVCASAGAASAPTDWEQPQLKVSTYQPNRAHDPFLPAGATVSGAGKTSLGSSTALRLQGIVYDAKRPSAMVNNEILYVNKPATVSTSEGAVEVTAVEIGRERVVLEVGGKRFELRLGLPGEAAVAQP